jgi:hypothetical protein
MSSKSGCQPNSKRNTRARKLQLRKTCEMGLKQIRKKNSANKRFTKDTKQAKTLISID